MDDFEVFPIQGRGENWRIMNIPNRTDTYKNIKKYATEVSKSLEEDDYQGDIWVSIEFPDRWRSGFSFRAGDDATPYDYATQGVSDVSLVVDPVDPHATYRWTITVRDPPEAGEGKNNDCLFISLFKAFYYCFNTDMPSKIKTDKKLKKLLKTNEGDKVELSEANIQTLENVIDACILIHGDIERTSNYVSKTNKTINLHLINKHITFKRNQQRNKELGRYMRYMNKDESISKFLVFKMNKLNTDFSFYGDEIDENGSYIDLKAYKKQYICIGYDRKMFNTKEIADKKLDKETELREIMKRQYEKLTEWNDEVKKLTDGKLDITRFKYKPIKYQALVLFNDMTKMNEGSEPLTSEEAKWISECRNCGLMYFEEYEGQAKQYDVHSRYPSIQCGSGSFPVKSGEFQTIDSIPDVPKFGIYRCKITGKSKLFFFNQNNKYTHTDIYTAKKLGLNIELITDGQPNFLFYGFDKLIKYCQLFKKYMQYLYELRKKARSNKLIKCLMNYLWGSLCERNTIKNTQDRRKPLTYPKGMRISEILPYVGDTEFNMLKFTFAPTKEKDIYSGDFPRIGVFLTATARNKLATLLKENEKDIRRVHTDGFIVSGNKEYKLGDEMGELALEKEGQVKITKLNDCKWNDDIDNSYLEEEEDDNDLY